ncbi:type II toxin-antitoxin system PemK/MazF family toxin [Aquabacterium sp. OR-4]|uniref:type II toxin-antitoxin system PemK/MazF family toxin n=1 Tax=Aquabacterium sp. OR-4 TaxID=2978127 RepID=UPI0021B4CEEE|nr:type II toxin-antitoxin system PemK/MazF family toxin [Aquabacterium sp. OR-4]MDT7835446.1 type II toxin-antitoxin system PemK/MazF family toxin [Aquabacterium sp. OR-4]
MSVPVIARRRVVLLPFPFSDLSTQKLRPALVLASAGRDDWLLCQITSKPYADARAVALAEHDFASGGLQVLSYARPAKLFTASAALVQTVAGELHPAAHQRVCEALIALLNEVA